LFSFDPIVCRRLSPGNLALAYLLALMVGAGVVDFVTGAVVRNKLSIAPAV
jgi:hypothetical protein